jgi:uncharacterized protein (DUF1697 family)
LASVRRTYVILLRAIGPMTHKLMPMSAWRDASQAAGFIAPETLVNTGNMITEFDGDSAQVIAETTKILRSFRLGDNVVPLVREPNVLQELINSNPISAAATERPNQTGVYFFADPQLDFTWLQSHDGPEVVHIINDHLVIDFHRDVAQSGKLIRQIDKHCGINTSRNWNSVRRIAERCRTRENA